MNATFGKKISDKQMTEVLSVLNDTHKRAIESRSEIHNGARTYWLVENGQDLTSHSHNRRPLVRYLRAQFPGEVGRTRKPMSRAHRAAISHGMRNGAMAPKPVHKSKLNPRINMSIVNRIAELEERVGLLEKELGL